MTEEKKSAHFFEQLVEEKQLRMIQARRKDSSIWINFTTFGVLGWTVALPTLVGVAIGIWLDKSFPGSYSYTLMLLAGGLIFGCFSGWKWIEGERQKIELEDAQIREQVKKDLEIDQDGKSEIDKGVE